MLKKEYLEQCSSQDYNLDQDLLMLKDDFNEQKKLYNKKCKERKNIYKEDRKKLKEEYNQNKVLEKDLTPEQLKDLRNYYKLPFYSRNEETFNSVTHIIGGGLGVVALVIGIVFAAVNRPNDVPAMLSMIFYGLTIIMLYTVSAIYHGLRVNKGKEVFQVLDHCTIYALIAGSYTPGVVMGLSSIFPWNIVFLGAIYLLAATGIVLNATMMRKTPVKIISMILYIAIGWSIVFFYPILVQNMGFTSTLLLIIGGVCYTVGSILYGIGSKRKYMHCIFHLFCIAGTVIQFLSILIGNLL